LVDPVKPGSSVIYSDFSFWTPKAKALRSSAFEAS
jgi:hypothetical protein